MKINIQEFEKRSEFIHKKPHPTLDMILWNYGPRTQIEDAWDEYTTMARGLITDKDGEILYRPFPKFFNVGQRPETMLENLPAELPGIYEKMDGSLAIQHYDGDTVCIATRGSWVSDQSKWATTWLQSKGFKKSDFKKGYTYLYEIIYRENRIVIDYKDRQELVLLAVINTETGKEDLDYIEEAKRLGLSYSKKMEFKTMQELLKYVEGMDATEEGFVLKYSNGLRIKIKSVEYLRLHKLLSGLSVKRIWDCLANHQAIEDVLASAPDEAYQWAIKTRDKLCNRFNELKQLAISLFNLAQVLHVRKEQARFLQAFENHARALTFAMLDHKDIEPMIWKMLKPQSAAENKQFLKEGSETT